MFAAAEERPAHAALVVLGARQGQRQQDDVAFVWQLAGVLGQLLRPVGIVDALIVCDAVCRSSFAEVCQGGDNAAGEVFQAGPQLERFLVVR